jgi:hypothetical protein
MKKRLIFVLPILLVLIFSAPGYANFYADVPWDIPEGKEAYTVPTTFAPSEDGTTGFHPFCKKADCSTGFKSIHDYIRDYTEETIGDASSPREAAEKIFYEVRDTILYEDINFFGAFFAYRFKRGNSGMKASLVNAMCRSANIPARLVIQEAQVQPKYLGYNEENGTSLINNATLHPAEFGSYHVYSELYLDNEWVAADPTWDSELADAFEIAKFGEKLKSVSSSGTPTISADYPHQYLRSQPHPYLFDKYVNPNRYNEDEEVVKYIYFTSRTSSLNNYLKNVRYKSTHNTLAGITSHGIAELQELKDKQLSSLDLMLAEKAIRQLEIALGKIGEGKDDEARSHMVDAENQIRGISIFWDDLDILTLRYRLASVTREGETAIIKPAEANPPLYDIVLPFDNGILNWKHLYGFGDVAPGIPWDGLPAWDDPLMEPYIFENFYLSFLGPNAKISTITEDSHTILFDPTNRMPDPGDPAPAILMDHFGTSYDPATTDYVYDGLTDYGWGVYGPYLQSEPVYSMEGSNGFSDFFEANSNERLTRYMTSGGWEWQRARQWPDDMNVANRLLDTYSDIPIYFFWGMDNQVFEEIVHRIADSGADNLILNVSNSLYAWYTWGGYLHELGGYIASSSNPGLNVVESPVHGHYDVYIEGVVDKIEEELNRPEYDGKRVIATILTHGFPYHDEYYTLNFYPGPSGWPTGYMYGEACAEPWHVDNWAEFDLILAEIARRPALFAKLDENGNEIIKDDEFYISGNMYSGGTYDPYDLWAGSMEWFHMHMAGMTPLDPILKQKVDSGETIDYFVDMPYFWNIESTEQVMHRTMIFGHGWSAVDMGKMIWFDDQIRSETVFNPNTPMGWGPGYDPINVVVTRELTEHQTFLHDAYMESYAEALACIDRKGPKGECQRWRPDCPWSLPLP